MTQILYVESPPAMASAVHCQNCDDEGENCWYDGPAAIQKHSDEYPEHSRITWLRREAA